MSSLRFVVSRFRLPFVGRYLSTQTTNTKSREIQTATDPNVMPTLDTSQLSDMEQIYIKRFEERHMRNVERRQRERRRARAIGLSFGALALAIYIYTIKRVRQETFLDNFDVPEPPPQKKAAEHD